MERLSNQQRQAARRPVRHPLPRLLRPLILGWRGKSDAEEGWEEEKKRLVKEKSDRWSRDTLMLLLKAKFFVCGWFSRRSSTNDKEEIEVIRQTSSFEGF